MSATFLGMPHDRPPVGTGELASGTPFPTAAARALKDVQLRKNLAHATRTIRDKRASVVAEMPDWEQLRLSGEAIKRTVMRRLPDLLEQFQRNAEAAGATVHWARGAEEACALTTALVRRTGATEVVKVKSMLTQEIELNTALQQAGISAIETDLAELIVQLGNDKPSHILVPAIHKNRTQIRDIFRATMAGAEQISDDPATLAMAARAHLRTKFLQAKVGISGANFAIAESGSLVVVESEGNGRMCLSLPQTLISLVGIEKIVPRWTDLEVFLQLLPRSSTGERMNPYTSTWTGRSDGDGPQDVHIILVDNGRTAVLADPQGRDALNCIRCSACLNVCPVYERTGGHSYGSVYPGPIGAVLSPQLTGVRENPTLPFASSLCGACFDACPVRIDIPRMLVHMRAEAVDADRGTPRHLAERAAMRSMAWVMGDAARFEHAQKLGHLGGKPIARKGKLERLPPPMSAWTESRDAPTMAAESFSAWWRRTQL